MKVKFLYGAEHFLLGELVELGRRLKDEQLEKMGLLEYVVKAEQEYYWRIVAISDLMRDFTGLLKEEIYSGFEQARQYAMEPKRNGSNFIGQSSRHGGRSLPKPGTLIIRTFEYYNFRFVVVDSPSKIIRFGDKDGGIYLNVSPSVNSFSKANVIFALATIFVHLFLAVHQTHLRPDLDHPPILVKKCHRLEDQLPVFHFHTHM